jgi:hypothetical protein
MNEYRVDMAFYVEAETPEEAKMIVDNEIGSILASNCEWTILASNCEWIDTDVMRGNV